jgi:N utilization substance protein B
MKLRTKARCVALQALYEIDIAGHPPEIVLQSRLEETSFDPLLEEFIKQIVLGVYSIAEILDGFIAENAPDWPLEQVAPIDRNIIRIALWEFAIYKQTPIKVAINEAVELAKIYGTDSTPRFVNGVLGSLSSKENEIQQKLKVLLEPRHSYFNTIPINTLDDPRKKK